MYTSSKQFFKKLKSEIKEQNENLSIKMANIQDKLTQYILLMEEEICEFKKQITKLEEENIQAEIEIQQMSNRIKRLECNQ